MENLRGILLVTIFGLTSYLITEVSAADSGATTRAAEKAFQDYFNKHTYDGATIAILQNNRLLFAGTQGKVHEEDARPGTLVPILGLSKLLTAVAVLQLVEDGELKLGDKVFGDKGLLPWIQPQKYADVDERIYDITLEHLLRHTAGWDETKGPIYDPMLNQVYVSRGNKVVDIAEELNLKGQFINEEDIMSFMMGKSLSYTPGTVVQHSNFGYSILGRIIESVTGMMYEEYVIESILVPAGMLHTRIGPPPNSQQGQEYFRSYLNMGAGSEDVHKTLFDILPPALVDSSLGWYSNVYDIGRLLTVLFGDTDFGVLRPASIRILLSRPETAKPYEVKSEIWPGMGNVMVKNDGSIRYGNSDPSIGSTVYFYYSYYQLQASAANRQRQSTEVRAEPEAVVFLGLSRHKHRKHLPDIADILLNPFITDKLQNENAYVEELADDFFDGTEGRKTIIRYRLSEHRLQLYASALRLAGFYPRWIHGYSHSEHTYYTIIAESALSPEELYYEIEVSPSEERIIAFLSDYLTGTDDFYKLSFAQSFRSISHDNKPCHLVMVSRVASEGDVEFAVHSDVEAYFSMAKEGFKEGFRPIIQSVDFNKHKHHVTYILRQDWQLKSKSDIKQYHDMSYADLEDVSRLNALEEYNLQYLDSYGAHGKPRFSAIFKKGDISGWLLQTKVEHHQLSEDMLMWRAMQYLPRLLVAYTLDDNLYFAGLWEKI